MLCRRDLAAAALLALALGAGAAAPTLKSGQFDPPLPAPDFVLQGSDNRELKLANHKGRVVLMFFGFTHCPEVCPTTLATLAQVRKQLGADAARVQVVYITVDPERDTPQRMAAYLRAFDAGFVGGTGKPEQLAAVRQQYGVHMKRLPMPGGYGIDHGTSVYVIDRQGRLRAMMPYGHSAADFVHDIRALLKP
jgi:protein SCO1